MLLLVLILVLIAFALLVVALLTGSVLSAWLSVAVSVAAAVVLVVDWLKRRSAVKAGSEPAPGPSRALADVDPVTEVLPVVPAGGRRFDESGDGADGDDSQRTIVMPAVKPASEGSGQPSGSASGPSGAADGITSSSGSSSLNVTKEPVGESSGAERTVVVDVSKKASAEAGSGSSDSARADSAPLSDGRADADGRAGSAAVAGLAAAAGAAAAGGAVAEGPVAGGAPRQRPDDKDGSAPPEPARPGGAGGDAGHLAPEPNHAAAEPVSADLSGAGSPEPARSGTPGSGDTAFGAGTSSTTALAPVHRNGATTKPTLSEPGGAEPAPVDPGPTVPAAAEGSAAPEADAPAAGLHEATSHGADPAGPSGAGDTVVTRVPVDRAATEAPSGGAESSPARAEQAYAGGLFEPTTAGAPPGVAEPVPPAADGEPPEEQPDPAAARIVAGAADEVLVVDEQPRYHVATCRSLVGKSVIPLPAREAVELGFTPCGWCTPDATLAARHRADSRP